jgi:hypothetical protein
MARDTDRRGGPARAVRLAALASLAAAALGGGPMTGEAAAKAEAGDGARMSILYDLDRPVRAIVRPPGGHHGLGAERGAFRQEGSNGHLFGRGRDARQRIGKVRGQALAGMSAAEMGAALRRQIEGGCIVGGRNYGCRSQLVAIDELGSAFRDGSGTPGAGARLSQALRALARMRARDGESYARHVHLYLGPALVTSLGARRLQGGAGGRGGRGWRGVMPALTLAGGVWLEMYHGAPGGSAAPFSAAEWRRVPTQVALAFARSGGDLGRVHFMLTGTDTPPGRVPAGCAGPMSCTWALADLPGVNRRLLATGPGAYRVGDQAGAWLASYNARFPAAAEVRRGPGRVSASTVELVESPGVGPPSSE